MSTPINSNVLDTQTEEDLLLTILHRLEKGEYDLPPLPQVAQKVLALAQNPDTHAAQLSALIQQDPMLTAKIFQTANSPLYGTLKTIQSIQQAITWLGLHQIAFIALSFAMQGTFKVHGYEKEVREMWMQAVISALYAKAIAKQMGESPDTLFLCGLLHTIGKPFIVHTVNQHQSDQNPALPWLAIISLMNQSYVEVGRQLAETWDFPKAVKVAITLHRDHTYHLSTVYPKVPPIVCLATHLAQSILSSDPAEKQALNTLPVLRFLGASPDSLEALLGMQEEILREAAGLLI